MILITNAKVQTMNIILRYLVFYSAYLDLKGVPDCLIYITKRDRVNQAVTTLNVETKSMLKTSSDALPSSEKT